MTGGADAGALTQAQFDKVRDWVYRSTGIQFAANKRYFVDKRVTGCVRRHGADFDRWFADLRAGGDPRVAQELVNELTVNETYFLREEHQLDALVQHALPDVLNHRAPGRPVRILSLPCSTGEEPYSIALKLLEEWPALAHVDVEIVAADIDTRVLDLARAGVYGARSMQRVPAVMRAKYFQRLPADRWQLTSDVRDAVEVLDVNVCDTDAMRPHRGFDVVFCRNLLIYFDGVSSRRAAENLFSALRPGGWLFLGHSESMSRISPIFTPVRLPQGIAYQRPRIGGA